MEFYKHKIKRGKGFVHAFKNGDLLRNKTKKTSKKQWLLVVFFLYSLWQLPFFQFAVDTVL